MPTDVKTSLPQVTLRDGSTVTVDTGDPAVVVTKLVIHGWEEVAPEPTDPGPLGGAYFAGDEVV